MLSQCTLGPYHQLFQSMKSRKSSKSLVVDGSSGFLDENSDMCHGINIEGHKLSRFNNENREAYVENLEIIGSKLPVVASPARPTHANTVNNTYEESRPQRVKSSMYYRFDDALKVKQLKPLKPKKEEMKKILRDSSSQKFEPKFKERKDKKMGKSQRRAEKGITKLPRVIHVQRQPAFLKIKTHVKNMPSPKISKIDEDILKTLGFAVKGILPSIVPRK